MLKNSRLLLVAIVFSLVVCAIGVIIYTTSSSRTKSAQIVFGADFGNNDGCDTHSNAGCDIFLADIELDGTVSSIRQLTDQDGAEVFPVFSADNEFVYANIWSNSKQADIEWINTDNGSSGTLQAGARGLAPLPNGKSAVFAPLVANSPLRMADFSSPTTLTNARAITPPGNYNEPHASVLGDIIFYQLFGEGKGSNTAQAQIYQTSTNKIIEVTPSDGTAHCFWGFNGTATYCNNVELFQGIQRSSFIDSVISKTGGSIRHPKPATVSAVDADYAICKTTSIAYGAFCDEDHLIVTLGCGTETASGIEMMMSKIALLDLTQKPPRIMPLGKNLATAFGGPGGSSYTASCRIK
jgi:hypothetical protein